jgi:hypothetical protein
MHDQAYISPPDRCGNGAFQERRENHIRSKEVRCLVGDPIMYIDLDRELVAVAHEVDIEALRQAVECMHQQQDAHQTSAGDGLRRYL